MKPGDLVRIINLGGVSDYFHIRVKTDGYLWVAEEPDESGGKPSIWLFKSVATGADLYAFEDRFERVEDAEEG
jgi:hypothetical protein